MLLGGSCSYQALSFSVQVGRAKPWSLNLVFARFFNYYPNNYLIILIKVLPPSYLAPQPGHPTKKKWPNKKNYHYSTYLSENIRYPISILILTLTAITSSYFSTSSNATTIIVEHALTRSAPNIKSQRNFDPNLFLSPSSPPYAWPPPLTPTHVSSPSKLWPQVLNSLFIILTKFLTLIQVPFATISTTSTTTILSSSFKTVFRRW